MNEHIKTSFMDRASPRQQVDQLVRRFSPYEFSDEQILRQSTGRESLLKRIARVIEENLERNEPPNQHLMVLGNRGMGKSFFVRQIQIEVQKLTKQGLPLIFVRLPEEQLNVSTPELLLDEIRRILTQTVAESVRVKWRSGDESAWHKSVEALHAAIAAQPGFANDAGLIVVSIENFDVLLEEIFDDEAAQSRLRDFLATETRVMLLSTSTTEVDNKHHKRLFQAFKREQLSPWTADEFVAFYGKTFQGEITDNIEAKIRALAHFTGGSPRLAVLIKDILHTNDVFSAVQTLDQLADELTPYFQDRIMSRLKSKSRWLLDDLLRSGEPCSQSDLAKRVGADSQSEIAQPFNALLREGVVINRKQRGKKGQYEVADRIFAHFYRKRYLADECHSPLANLVEFLERFYSQSERAEKVLVAVRAGKSDEAQVLIETLGHGQDAWGKVDLGSRIRHARRFIHLVQECLNLAAEPGFLKALLKVADNIGTKHVTETIGEAQVIAKNTRTPTEEIAALIVYAAILLILPNDEKAMRDLTEALEKSRNIAHSSLIQLSLYALGLAEAFAGRGLDAQKHLAESTQIMGSIERPQIYSSAISHQMWNFIVMEEYDKAVDIFDQTRHDSVIFQDSQAMSNFYRYLSYIKTQQGEHKTALEAAEKAVEFGQLANDDCLLSLASGNLSYSFTHFKHYDEALQAAKLAREAGERIEDRFLVLSAMHSELCALVNLSRHRSVIEGAPMVIQIARKLVDPAIEARAQWILADAYQSQSQTNKELSARRAAVKASLESNDVKLTLHLQGSLLSRLHVVGENCSEEIVDLFMVHSTDLSANQGDIRRLPFDRFSKAATQSNRWSEVIDWLSDTPDLSINFLQSSMSVGDAVVELYDLNGIGPAFSAMAGFLSAIREPFRRISIQKNLNNFIKTLLSTTCSQLIAHLPHPGLLQDIADELREQLKTDDIADMLEAAAQYHKQGEKPASLDGIDPDISKAVRVVLGIGASDQVANVTQKKRGGSGKYERADHLINDQTRIEIADRLAEGKTHWEASPCYTTQWITLDRNRCVELVVAALGAAKQASIDHADTLFSQLTGALDQFGIVTERALSNVRAVRELSPTFYPDWRLVEISLSIPESDHATLCFLLNAQFILPVLGTSPPIHELNAQQGTLSLTTNASVADYLRFFCNSVWGDDGPFRIIEQIDQIPRTKPYTKNEYNKIISLISFKIVKYDNNAWTTTALVNYEDALFLSDFKIQTLGQIEMLNDEQMMSLENVKQEQLYACLRYFNSAAIVST